MKVRNLDHLRVASPCPVGWEQMNGDNRVRFCSLCQLNVYNFAELTQKEAEELLRTTEGRICGRLFRRADGTIITKDCPVGLRAMRRKVAKVATAAFATLVSLCSAAAGQKQSDRGEACRQQVKITSKVDQVSSSSGTVTGTLVDPNGAFVTNVDITITNRSNHRVYHTKSNDEGRFTQSSLTPANYEVTIDSPPFKRLKIASLKVAAGQILMLEATLLSVTETTVTVGIIAEDSLIDTTPGLKTVISGDMIRKLPY